MYASYKKFLHCDDGAIGEGYSESVARLLSDEWSTSNQLVRSTAADRGFKQFVLRHVDELMSPTQAAKIGDNSSKHCPVNVRFYAGQSLLGCETQARRRHLRSQNHPNTNSSINHMMQTATLSARPMLPVRRSLAGISRIA